MRADKWTFFNTIIFKYSTKEEYQSLKNSRNRISTFVCMNCFACSLQNKCQTVDPDRQKLVGPTGFPSLPYINFGKIVLRSGKFPILFWRLCLCVCQVGTPRFFQHSIALATWLKHQHAVYFWSQIIKFRARHNRKFSLAWLPKFHSFQYRSYQWLIARLLYLYC